MIQKRKGDEGLEPPASCTQSKHSTTWASHPVIVESWIIKWLMYKLVYVFYNHKKKNKTQQKRTISDKIQQPHTTHPKKVAGRENRTLDLRLMRASLCQLSYSRKIGKIQKRFPATVNRTRDIMIIYRWNNYSHALYQLSYRRGE